MDFKKVYTGVNIRVYEVGKYEVIFSNKGASCTCAGSSAWNRECKHIKLIKDDDNRSIENN